MVWDHINGNVHLRIYQTEQIVRTGENSQAMPHIIFLSYAHDDNKVPENGFTGWVDFFDRTLSIELLERALDCELWRDRRDVDPIAFFDDEILNAVCGRPAGNA